MRLVICDSFKKIETVENVSVVPHVGEQIAWYYTPTPTVKSVVYDYENNAIYVAVE
jgi:hypothetical protein